MPTKPAKKSTAPSYELETLKRVTVVSVLERPEAFILHQPCGSEKLVRLFILARELQCCDVLSKRWNVRLVLCTPDWEQYYVKHAQIPLPAGFDIYI